MNGHLLSNLRVKNIIPGLVGVLCVCCSCGGGGGDGGAGEELITFTKF